MISGLEFSVGMIVLTVICILNNRELDKLRKRVADLEGKK